MNLLRSKEADMSVLAKEARQIVSEGRGNGEGRVLHQHTQSIKSDLATLLQLVEDRMLRIHHATSSGRGIVSEIGDVIDSFERKERMIVRRPLPIEAESVDDEISHIASLRSQIFAEVDTVMSKVDEQKHLSAEASDTLPAEIQQAVDELESVSTRILVRVIDTFAAVCLLFLCRLETDISYVSIFILVLGLAFPFSVFVN